MGYLKTKVSGKAEKAYAVFNALKNLGYEVEIYMFTPDIGSKKGQVFICVDDNSHFDCDGNPYSYTFDPRTGREIHIN